MDSRDSNNSANTNNGNNAMADEMNSNSATTSTAAAAASTPAAVFTHHPDEVEIISTELVESANPLHGRLCITDLPILESIGLRRDGAGLEPVARMILPPTRLGTLPFNRPLNLNFDALKSERERLESFSQPPGWPIPFIRPEDLAKAAFFFVQDRDKVQCAFCRGVIGEWELGDIPLSEHRRHFPQCPFILGLPVGNITLQQQQEQGSVAENQEEEEEDYGVDICGHFTAEEMGRVLEAQAESSGVRGAQPLRCGAVNEAVTSLGIRSCGNGPIHPNLVTVSSRLNSFVDWPAAESGMSPEAMAEAGLFYLGRKDYVKCFYCSGGLRNWEATDDPWMEHARWFPDCTYVLLMKGEDYVKEVNNGEKANQQLTVPQKPPLPCSANAPRQVSDQELQELLNTSIVKAALEMGIELAKIKRSLKRRIQQNGMPFMTIHGLLEAVLDRDPEYDSDSNDDYEEPTPGPSTSMAASTSAAASQKSSGNGDDGQGKGEAVPAAASPSEPAGSEEGASASTLNVDPEPGNSGRSAIGQGQAAAPDPDLEEELQRLREEKLCKICLDSDLEVVFLPCGHVVSCIRCATALSGCALCRQPIKAFVKIHFG